MVDIRSPETSSYVLEILVSIHSNPERDKTLSVRVSVLCLHATHFENILRTLFGLKRVKHGNKAPFFNKDTHWCYA